jgi:hypothetical protein
MKRLLAVAMAALFIAGCGAVARESGYYEHDTLYKDCDHMKFSISGYKDIDQQVVKECKDRDWWGLEVEGCPAK